MNSMRTSAASSRRRSARVGAVARCCQARPPWRGSGRVDVRVAEDSAGELYLLTKSDGMVRQVMGIR